MLLRRSIPNFVLFLLLSSHYVYACLESIDPALGANPSFFNMSEQVNNEIYHQNLSADEKFYLLIHNNFPEAQLLSNIRSYNLLLPLSCPPNGTEVVDKGFIKSAWVRAITVMPSITDEEENYWALPKGEVLVAHNYSIQLPRSATNVHPDCGIVYTLLNSSENLSIYLNDAYLGSSTLTNYETNSQNLDVRAELLLSATMREDHYVSICYCCKSGKDGCESTCCSCQFSNTEFDEEQVSLNHSIQREIYRLEALPELTMLHCPNNPLSTAFGNLSVRSNAPLQSIYLSFGDANLSLQMHELNIKPILKPHNVLEAQALPSIYEYSQNMFVDRVDVSRDIIQLNFTGVPPEGARAPYATLLLTDIFGVIHNFTNHTRILCPLNPEMELVAPHWAEEGSSFQATVKLSEGNNALPNKRVMLHYSGEEHAGITDSEGAVNFALKANWSLVEAKFDYDGIYAGVSARRNLMVYSSSGISYLLSLLAFLFILALSYIAFRLIAWRGK